MDEKSRDVKLQEKYRQLYVKTDKQGFGASGIFVEARRRKLFELKTEREQGERKRYNYWYQVRQKVKTALIDLRLFIFRQALF